MACRIVIVEVQRTRQLGPCTCRRQIEVYRATVVEVTCDGGCEPAGVACCRNRKPPALQAANALTACVPSPNPKEMAA